jgi:hypothetical protein
MPALMSSIEMSKWIAYYRVKSFEGGQERHDEPVLLLLSSQHVNDLLGAILVHDIFPCFRRDLGD